MARARPHLCLVASGGGHLRQLLDLEPFWCEHSFFFVTEDTALARTLSERYPVRVVDHVALGQAKLGAPFRMLVAAIRSLFQSLGIIWSERPDIVVTTGAGSCFFTVLWGRLFGAKVILVDSFARFDGPSVFARICSPFAHVRIAQSAASAKRWQGSLCFDPFQLIDGPIADKKSLLFATVGATLPFDRLVHTVAAAKARGAIPERVVLQVGEGGARPEIDGIEVYETLPFDRVLEHLRDADLVVCHGGTGSLITALREGCRTIVIPRSFRRGEHYDDHQGEIANAFAERGLVSVVVDENEFEDRLAEARVRARVSATTNPSQLIAFLQEQTRKWSPKA
jgi:UDP-N-acetylglucosamine--N-acetylmuramyl-(pentapeptide) pyrophosphoryl-undecaprenol N-acetylglucosamine transferase